MTTLGETGQIRITLAAARRWLVAAGSDGIEAARAELLAVVMDAAPVDREVAPERWRARSKSHGWDVSVAVVREGGGRQGADRRRASARCGPAEAREDLCHK